MHESAQDSPRFAGASQAGDAGGDEARRIEELEREVLERSRDLHRLHRELAALQETLRAESEQREGLVAVLAHELRTPLTVIRGYLRLLLNEEAGPVAPGPRRFVEEAERGCGRLDALVERMLEAAHAPQPAPVLEVAQVALAPLCESLAGGLRERASERGLVLDLRIPEGLRARCDPGRVEQVIGNLLSNALRHAAEGGKVALDARRLRREGRAWIEVSVSDDGPGVPPEERARIFEPWARGASETQGSGLGLGLAICRRIVETHGGRIGVGELPGGGARFWFTLPGGEDAPR